jgi:lysophospholipase L1-like esterase
MFGIKKTMGALAGLLAFTATGAFAVNVACVGNSITEGYGIDWGEKKYPDHLQELMQPGDSAANFGTSGKMFYKESGESYWVQGKIKEALAFPADIVVIELGTNDSKLFYYTYYNVTVDMLKPSYEDLLDTFAHLPTHPEIYATLQPYSNNESWGIMDSTIVKYINPLIKETSVEKGVNIIDLHTLFQTPAWFLDDSVHPNPTGAQELAKIVNKYITLAKPTLKQEQATLQIESDAYGVHWYKDGKLMGDHTDKSLALTEKGKYKALVKVESDNDSWLLSNEVEVTDLTGQTTGISKDRHKETRPKIRKLRHKVDVKGRVADGR